MLHSLTNLIYEMLHLKHIHHEWWRLIGVQNPDSVAEHSLSAAQIAYILAKMEGANAEHCATLLVWHDMAETRIGDLHRNASQYLTGKHEAEMRVVRDQTAGIDFWVDIEALFLEFENVTTIEAQIARDADYLEQAFQAHKYAQNGYQGTQRWIDNVGKHLQTESAKKLWEDLQKTDSWEWTMEGATKCE